MIFRLHGKGYINLDLGVPFLPGGAHARALRVRFQWQPVGLDLRHVLHPEVFVGMGQEPAAYVAEGWHPLAGVQAEYSFKHPDKRLYRDDVEEAIHQEGAYCRDPDHRYGSDNLG